MKRITKTEAAAALREHAFRVTDLDSDDYGRQIIHCVGSFSGADWDLDDAIRVVSKAKAVAWEDHWLGHNLGVMDNDGCVWHFAVPLPEGGTAE